MTTPDAVHLADRRAAAHRAAPRLNARDLTVSYTGSPVLHGVDLSVPGGAITAVIGPNGSGKSTMLRALGRLLQPRGGGVTVDGQPINALPSREVARRIGVLPQDRSAPDGLTVADLVARGRHPHQRWFQRWGADDEQAVARVLARTGLLDQAERPVDQLSGGQRQRAWIAMVLAQDTDVLLLDEPTTFLDVAHAVDMLDLIEDLHTERPRTVVMVLHDINLAARYAHQVVVMHDGRVAAYGPPATVITSTLIETVFGLPVVVTQDPVAGTPLVVPIGRRHRSGGHRQDADATGDPQDATASRTPGDATDGQSGTKADRQPERTR
jgi:iron complex transport system ATP-binding protein